MVRHRFASLAIASACAALAWSLPAGAHTAAASATHVSSVTVTEGKPSEFRFTLSRKSEPIGIVMFKVVNKGTIPHDFKIHGHASRILSPGKTQTIKVSFTKKGSYAYVCTIPGHTAAGMKGIFKIT